MSQIGKLIIAVVLTAVIVSAGFYVYSKKSVQTAPATTVQPSEWKQIVQYQCEQSGGTFKDVCVCPTEFADNDMYDKKSGQCQTTFGGPGGALGDAINSCVGLRLALDECKSK